MSRDLTEDECKEFNNLYGTGSSCKKCGDVSVSIKIWEKYGSNAHEIGGDIGPEGIVGALIACDVCEYTETVERSHILKAG